MRQKETIDRLVNELFRANTEISRLRIELTSPKSGKTEYNSWRKMLRRCHNMKDKNYDSYGGRGITVCKEWWSFERFLKDMGRKPGGGYSIDRIDNDLGYFKENCRWATHQQQMGNRKFSLVCRNGHRKEGENLLMRNAGNGNIVRSCRKCVNERDRKRKAKIK